MNEIIIPENDVLDKEQFNLLESIRKFYPVVPKGMTNYQIEMFVLGINDFPTWYSVYYQCILESWNRFTLIIQELDAIKSLKLRINYLETKFVRDYIHKGIELTNLEICRKDISKHQVDVLKRNLSLKISELQIKFREIEIFENVKNKIEQNKFKDGIPEYGDDKQEAMKWYLKFICNKYEMRKSLVRGDQSQFNLEELKGLFEDNEMKLLFGTKNVR